MIRYATDGDRSYNVLHHLLLWWLQNLAALWCDLDYYQHKCWDIGGMWLKRRRSDERYLPVYMGGGAHQDGFAGFDLGVSSNTGYDLTCAIDGDLLRSQDSAITVPRSCRRPLFTPL